jgi:4-carboxymuconolactone decarboxylase
MSGLSERDRRLVRLFAAIALGRWDEVERLRREAPPGEPDRAWREAVLQVHVFAGFPRAVEAYAVLAAAGGLGTLDEDEVLREADNPERGLELFERIYHPHAGAVRRILRSGHPDFEAWILGHAYGRLLSRPGLSADRRELLAVAALTALGQDRQLASHARGSLRCGATREELLDVLDELRGLAAPEYLDRARSVIG